MKHMESYNKILEKIKENNLDIDIEKLTEAYILASEAHEGQMRKSGEDYIIHPIEVTEILADLKMDTETLVAGLLHDVVEDTLIGLADIEYVFGKDVAHLVDGVTKLRNLPKQSGKKVENIRKMVVAMSEDIRVVIIKLADRLHNMRTLQYQSVEKQIEKSQECIDVFAPIAHRIGMAKIKSELEDISFRYLNPVSYNEIKELVNTKKDEREEIINDIISKIRLELKENNIEAEVSGRPKHLYSIYKKMTEKNKKFADLMDLIAIRVIVNKEVECYSVLGIVHSIFVPVSGRFKDYIAVPKANGYQSIHTTVKTEDGHIVEIQTRTHAMHNVAEDGVAAHWKYKERKGKAKEQQYYAAIKKILENANEKEGKFAKIVTEEVLNKTIFVFTPKGDVIELPFNSTALDFAFQIHTQIGYRTIGAKINDRIVPLDCVLKNGDTIEVLTTKSTKGPGKDWIKMVNNSSSRSKIKKWFKDIEFEEKSKEGEQLLISEFDKKGINFKEYEDDERIHLYMKKYNVPSIKQLFYKFANGDCKIESLLNKFEAKEEENIEKTIEENQEKAEIEKNKNKDRLGVKITGSDNTMFHFAKCCNPLPGEDIDGYVTRGRGIVIHRTDCNNMIELTNKEPERNIEVFWDEEFISKGSTKYQFTFTAKTQSRDGILLDIIRILNAHKMDLLNVNTTSTKENGIAYGLITFTIMLRKKEDFERLSQNLLVLPDVVDIIRK